jgi:hypothetical protein
MITNVCLSRDGPLVAGLITSKTAAAVPARQWAQSSPPRTAFHHLVSPSPRAPPPPSTVRQCAFCVVVTFDLEYLDGSSRNKGNPTKGFCDFVRGLVVDDLKDAFSAVGGTISPPPKKASCQTNSTSSLSRICTTATYPATAPVPISFLSNDAFNWVRTLIDLYSDKVVCGVRVVASAAVGASSSGITTTAACLSSESVLSTHPDCPIG